MNQSLAWLPRSTRQFVNSIIKRHQLSIVRFNRRGPRFLVATVQSPVGPAILKVGIIPRSRARLFNEKFAREVSFLQYVATTKLTMLRAAVPIVYAGGVQLRVWYLREFIRGRGFDYHGGNVRFKPAFFTPIVLSSLGKLFHDLHRLPAKQLPPVLQPGRKRYDSARTALEILNASRRIYVRRLGGEKYYLAIRQKLSAVQAEYDRTATALTHHEPYPVHFFMFHRQLRLIDWENIYWAAPVRDWVILWFHSLHHPAWQRQLRRTAIRETRGLLGSRSKLVWNTDLLIIALYLVLASKKTGVQRGVNDVIKLAKKIIRLAINRPGFFYEDPLRRV